MGIKTLVVGGAGYIGGEVTDLIPGTVVYDNLLFEEDYLKPVNFVQGDIRDHAKLKPLLDKAHTVIWLAALVGDGACAVDPKLTYEINTDSVKWLAENFNGRIVFPSTCSVYGAQDGLLNENSPTNPLSAYADSKLKAEAYLKGKDATIFRLGTVFGVGDDYSRTRLDLVVNTMTARAVTEGKLQVFGGEQWRPLIHVRDVALALMLATNPEAPTGTHNLVYKNYRMSELAQEVSQITGAEVEIVDMKFEDQRNYQVEQIFTLNSYASVPDGIEEIINRVARIKDIHNPRYSNQAYLEGLWK